MFHVVFPLWRGLGLVVVVVVVVVKKTQCFGNHTCGNYPLTPQALQP